MRVTQKIKMDLAQKGVEEFLGAVQGDADTRFVEITLEDDGQPLSLPDGVSGVVRYRRADGRGGSYDTGPAQSHAVTFDKNVATVAIAPDVLAVPGNVRMTIGIVTGGKTIHTFVFLIHVEANPGINVMPVGTYYLAGTVPDSGWEPEMYLGTDKDGKVVAKPAPTGSNLLVVAVDGLEENGQASHTPAQMVEHMKTGGYVVLKAPFDDDITDPAGGYFPLALVMEDVAHFVSTRVTEDYVYEHKYVIQEDGSYKLVETQLRINSETGKPIKDFKIIEHADGSITMKNTFTDGTYETIVLAAGEKPASATYNGVEIPIKWVVGA